MVYAMELRSFKKSCKGSGTIFSPRTRNYYFTKEHMKPSDRITEKMHVAENTFNLVLNLRGLCDVLDELHEGLSELGEKIHAHMEAHKERDADMRRAIKIAHNRHGEFSYTPSDEDIAFLQTFLNPEENE